MLRQAGRRAVYAKLKLLPALDEADMRCSRTRVKTLSPVLRAHLSVLTCTLLDNQQHLKLVLRVHFQTGHNWYTVGRSDCHS